MAEDPIPNRRILHSFRIFFASSSNCLSIAALLALALPSLGSELPQLPIAAAEGGSSRPQNGSLMVCRERAGRWRGKVLVDERRGPRYVVT